MPKVLTPAVAPATPKNTNFNVLIERPTETKDKPFITKIERPQGTEVRIFMTLLEFIQYGKVFPMKEDGSDGVQRNHTPVNSADYAQSILNSFVAGTPDHGLRHDPIINFEGIVTSGPALRFSPDTKVSILDAQHFKFALDRVYAEMESTNDPVLKMRIRSFLNDTEILVRVTLDWSLEDQRRLFYDVNGRAKVVSGAQNAFYAVKTGSAKPPMQLAGEAVELLRTDPSSPLRNRIGINGKTPKGGFAFQVLQKLIDKYMPGNTPKELAQAFGYYWEAIEGTFPEQKELTNTGYREAFLQAYPVLSKTGQLDVLARSINGQLAVMMPLGATGSGAIHNGVYKFIVGVLKDAENGHHGEDAEGIRPLSAASAGNAGYPAEEDDSF